MSTTGTLVAAENVAAGGHPAIVINGVTFVQDFGTGNTASVTSASGFFTLSTAAPNGVQFGNTAFGPTSGTHPPFTNLSAAYQDFLRSGDFNSTTDTSITLTLTNLTIGTNYLFQVWTNDSLDQFPGSTLTATSGNAVLLDQNTTDSDGGLGQYVIGTFTADSTSQAITFTPSGGAPNTSGFQLRVVPEPTSAELVLLFGSALVLLRRIRRHQ